MLAHAVALFAPFSPVGWRPVDSTHYGRFEIETLRTTLSCTRPLKSLLKPFWTVRSHAHVHAAPLPRPHVRCVHMCCPCTPRPTAFAPASYLLSRTKLFIGNLPPDTDDDLLRQTFGQYGDIDDVHVMKKRGVHSGNASAFVRFRTREQADLAINTLNGYPVPLTS